MYANSTTRFGDFTVFGLTQDPQGFLHRKLKEQLGIVPRVIDFGNAGHFFLYTSYGDVAETETAIALKLGFVRSLTRSPLSAQQLLDQKIVTPQAVDYDAIRGNALVACFSKTEAKSVVFKNLMSLPQLYYWASGGEWIGSDNLRYMVTMLDRVSLNEDIIPHHFMFRHVPGTLTYFQGVHRLFPGQLLKWQEGNLGIHCVQDLLFPGDDLAFARVDSHYVTTLYQELKDVVGAYISDIEKSGCGLGNLLSGGVDSSIIQLILNEQCSSTPLRSFSYVPTEAPHFEFEREYARQASAIFETEHTFIEFTSKDYPGLVTRTIQILGQPAISDIEPCKLALAEFLRKYVKDIDFFFVAQGADALFGLGITQKIKVLEFLGKVPGSGLAMAGAGRLLKPFTWKGQTLLKGAQMLSQPNNPHLFIAPTNTVAVLSNLDIARHSFGDETIRQVLKYRRDREIQYLDSTNYTEKVHVIDLLSETYEVQVQSSQLFLANNKQQIYPFMDDDVIRISFAFPPEIRYTKGLLTKPILKAILERRGLHTITRKPKGASGLNSDLYAWMRSGPLHEMVRDIDRPGFLSKADFERLVEKPDYFLWSLLTFDIFQKKILRANR